MKEEEIRKRSAFNRYLELVELDIKEFFDFTSFSQVLCPACGNSKSKAEFVKKGFTYASCEECDTLFVNPRPSIEVLSRFYEDSPSTRFWINDFFKPVAEIRREKIFKPRIEYIVATFADKNNGFIGDIGAGFGIFLEELKKVWPLARLTAIEPSFDQAEICRSKKLEVQCCIAEELKGFDESFDLLTAFELFEHLYDPARFLTKSARLLKSGGQLLLTTLNGEGFDIQLLWEKSKSISPPHHLNFFNPRSLRLLLENNGFMVEEITTPGKLDWDIVEGMIKKEGYNPCRFWSFFAHKGNEKTKQQLQRWISENNLSSHLRVIAKKI